MSNPPQTPVHAQQAAAAAALLLCVRRCADAQDERGRWRAEAACRAALQGTAPVLSAGDAAAAAAARAVGRVVASATAAALQALRGQGAAAP